MSASVARAQRAQSQQSLGRAGSEATPSPNAVAAVQAVSKILNGSAPPSATASSILRLRVRMGNLGISSSKQTAASPAKPQPEKPDHSWLTDPGPIVMDPKDIPQDEPITMNLRELMYLENEKGIEIPPKPLPDDENILSPQTFAKFFPGRSSSLLPNMADIDRLNVQLTGIDFSGTLNDASLSAFINKFPKMTMIQLYNCTQIGYAEWAHLHDLSHVTHLSLGKIARATPRDIWLMLRGWKSLRDVQFIDLPIDDQGLNRLSLTAVEKLTLSECDRITVKGLYSLTIKDRAVALKSLSISGPSIDPLAAAEFRRRRPDVDLRIDNEADKSAAMLAISEASQRMKEKSRSYSFLNKWKTEDEEEITEAYLAALESIGLTPKSDKQTDHLGQSMWYDQLLQAYQNITRAAWAVRQEMVTAGCFMKTDTEDPGPPPKTIGEIIECAQTYARKIQTLDFEDLELTYIPSFILELTLPRLRTIQLKGTNISWVQNRFRLKCPCLMKIIYADKVEELTPAPIERDQRPIPEEMNDPIFPPRQDDEKMPLEKKLPKKSWTAASAMNGKKHG